MRERPIIFSAPMVRAILEGRKTQTRRVVKWDTARVDGERASVGPDGYKSVTDHTIITVPWNSKNIRHLTCLYGEPGDRLWVRETWANFGGDADLYQHHKPGVAYRATWDGDKYGWPDFAHHVSYVPGDKWRPSIFMPRWASRITLEITEIRVQRAQEISGEDIKAEGIEGDYYPDVEATDPHSAAIYYMELWDSLNSKRGYGWDKNPWVWAITFRRIAP